MRTEDDSENTLVAENVFVVNKVNIEQGCDDVWDENVTGEERIIFPPHVTSVNILHLANMFIQFLYFYSLRYPLVMLPNSHGVKVQTT